MHTNIDIDRDLLEKALDLGHMKTKKAVVNEALAEYVRAREKAKIVELFGKVDFRPDYDYKALRRMR
jgi:type IV secretory pathway component VirB8